MGDSHLFGPHPTLPAPAPVRPGVMWTDRNQGLQSVPAKRRKVLR